MAVVLGGCRADEGAVSKPMSPESAAKEGYVPVNFRYLPKLQTYRYASTTTSSHVVERRFAVKVARVADRFVAESTIEASLVDGQPELGVTESMLKAFKLTTTLDPHGAVVSSHAEHTDHFLGPDARDIGFAFELPSNGLKPGDSWTQSRGGYDVTFTFIGVQSSGSQRLATFEERAKAGNRKVDIPTKIVVDADTGVLVDKFVETQIPSGPKPTDPLVPVRSEIKLLP